MTPSDRLHQFVMAVWSFNVRNPDVKVPSAFGAVRDVNAIQRAERFNSVRKIIQAPKPLKCRPKQRRRVLP